MAAARVYSPGPRPWRRLITSMCGWSALSLLPDLDVVGFRFGIKYADAWGHRGASHSLAMALVIALVLATLAPLLRRQPQRTFVVAALVVASHPLLDILTTGGLGCALWWPFDLHRYFDPWRPIPVAPLGGRFFSDAGLRVALVELVLFSPVFLFALWPRKKRA